MKTYSIKEMVMFIVLLVVFFLLLCLASGWTPKRADFSLVCAVIFASFATSLWQMQRQIKALESQIHDGKNLDSGH
jgi:uncharacterized membrane protein